MQGQLLACHWPKVPEREPTGVPFPMETFFQQIINGLVLGSMLSLIHI